MRLDRSFWVVAATAMLTLASTSLLICPTAHAGGPPPSNVSVPSATPTQASRTALTLEMDDDGDELLEHWGDAKYSREERLQLAGMAVLLTGAGVGGVLRRRGFRRATANG